MPISLQKITLILLAMTASFFANAQKDHKDDHSHRTCGTMEVYEQENQDPAVASKRAAMERVVQQYISSNAGQRTSATTITIPVVVHIVYNTSTQNISDAQIQSQINILNADFAKTNADVSLTPALFAPLAASSDIQFCLAQRTPGGVSTNGITRTYTNTTSFSQNNAVKSSATGGVDAWDPTKYLNIWVCELGGGLLGYAQFPGGAVATDGVVIGHFCFGNQGTAASPYNLGRTATHEIGHWLNLRHIWGDATCGDDLVSDTPTQSASNGGCPSYPHPTCSNTSDMFMNYMDYTNDNCMYMFTTGQASRMRAAVSASRPGLLTSNGCTPSTLYCTGLTTLTAPSGTVTDGSGANNYNNVTSCQWLIQPVGATSITLSFTAFNTEATNDVVTVYNGTNASGTVVGTYSGSTLPSSLVVTGSAVFVNFSSNASVTSTGWSFNYTSVVPVVGCSGLSTYTATSGTITDGSGAGNYPNYASCQFLIQAPAGSGGVNINFTQFSTEANYDYVTIYDGTSTAGTLLGSYSGTSLPSTVVAQSGAAYITFTSDISNVSSGWSLNYTYSPVASLCSGLNTYTASSGTVTDGSGASSYLNNSNCQFLVQPSPSATYITLTFTSFSVEDSYDKVYVYNGNSAAATLIGTYTGSTVPPVLIGNAGAMFVVFTSDNTITSTGWSFNYTSSNTPPSTCVSSTTLTGATGTFTDGSGAGTYSNYVNCSWLIRPTVTAQSIAISFSDFSTESVYDQVKIYAGTSATGTLVATYSGSSLPGVTTVTGPAAFVVFTTDQSITYNGWTLNYTSTATGVASAQLDGDITVYPNPADDHIIIKAMANNSSVLSCKLLNAYGQQIWVETFNQSQIEISTSLSGLPSGMYYVQVTDENGRTKVEKIVKK